MKKLILLSTTILLFGFTFFKPLGYPDLSPDTNPTQTYATQFGNSVNVSANVFMLLPPINGSFTVGFYLSTDTTIAITDKLIATYTVYISGFPTPSSTMCSINNIDLSQLSVASGTYYIGTFVDNGNNVAENGFAIEIDNNSWAFRNATGAFKVINYPGLDLGINEFKIKNDFEKNYLLDGNLELKSKSESSINVQLYALDGKLIYKNNDIRIVIPKISSGVYLLLIETENGTLKEKILIH